MLRCRWCHRCKKIIEVGFLCVCLGIAEVGPHTHTEQYAPPETGRITTVAISTSTSTGPWGWQPQLPDLIKRQPNLAALEPASSFVPTPPNGVASGLSWQVVDWQPLPQARHSTAAAIAPAPSLPF